MFAITSVRIVENFFIATVMIHINSTTAINRLFQILHFLSDHFRKCLNYSRIAAQQDGGPGESPCRVAVQTPDPHD